MSSSIDLVNLRSTVGRLNSLHISSSFWFSNYRKLDMLANYHGPVPQVLCMCKYIASGSSVLHGLYKESICFRCVARLTEAPVLRFGAEHTQHCTIFTV
jgi:hypothetical protein